jgi:hypothetical protein
MPYSYIVAVRCCERLLIVGAGFFLAYLGYRLYGLGVTGGNVDFSWQGLILKGTGPGLAFMAAGAVLLFRVLGQRLEVELARSCSPDGTTDEIRVRAQGMVDRPPGV